MPAPMLYAVAAGLQTKHLRPGPMGAIVPLHHPVRLVEEIAVADQMLGGRLEVGLVAGIQQLYFGPFGGDFEHRRERLKEFVQFLKRAYAADGAFDFAGKAIHQRGLKLNVKPAQRPHPPLWIETRDPETLSFCAQNGIDAGYFFFFSRDEAHPRYTKFIADWKTAGWARKPRVAYCTLVYVDETDEKALDVARAQMGAAYRGFFPATESEAELRSFQREHARKFRARGEDSAAEIVEHLLDADWLLEQDLVLAGSPETVSAKLKDWASKGLFNAFFGEFNFSELTEAQVMRSIRLFGEQVIPALRSFEPF
jgi:alkanesulfonate monooxygenase SsuD/methylene tetrahydromethanopterin reductase-like flavin-dependent oxidoreductase (luciferase family)